MNSFGYSPDCLKCDWIEPRDFRGWTVHSRFHCGKGCFDIGGRVVTYAMSGLERPNKSVAKARENCPFSAVQYDKEKRYAVWAIDQYIFG
jgi:hypothetical protein